MNDEKPIVLGKVQKGKTGKPLVVVIIFLFIGAALFFLPTIAGYFGDYKVIDLIKNGQIIDFFINHDYYVNTDNNVVVTTTTTQATNENLPVLINNTAIIKYNNFVLDKFEISTKDIKFTITTSNTIDFNNSNYYLVLYQNDKEIEKLKLSSEITTSGELVLPFNEELENTVAVTGIIKEITENTPIASTKPITTEPTTTTQNNTTAPLICVKDTIEIEYIFTQTFLTSIKETYTYNNLNDGNYKTILEEHKKKVEELNALNAKSIIKEEQTGFMMITTIDLSIYNYTKNTNDNYYPLNSQRLKIIAEMGEKGYNCSAKE